MSFSESKGLGDGVRQADYFSVPESLKGDDVTITFSKEGRKVRKSSQVEEKQLDSLFKRTVGYLIGCLFGDRTSSKTASAEIKPSDHLNEMKKDFQDASKMTKKGVNAYLGVLEKREKALKDLRKNEFFKKGTKNRKALESNIKEIGKQRKLLKKTMGQLPKLGRGNEAEKFERYLGTLNQLVLNYEKEWNSLSNSNESQPWASGVFKKETFASKRLGDVCKEFNFTEDFSVDAEETNREITGFQNYLAPAKICVNRLKKHRTQALQGLASRRFNTEGTFKEISEDLVRAEDFEHAYKVQAGLNQKFKETENESGLQLSPDGRIKNQSDRFSYKDLVAINKREKKVSESLIRQGDKWERKYAPKGAKKHKLGKQAEALWKDTEKQRKELLRDAKSAMSELNSLAKKGLVDGELATRCEAFKTDFESLGTEGSCSYQDLAGSLDSVTKELKGRKYFSRKLSNEEKAYKRAAEKLEKLNAHVQANPILDQSAVGIREEATKRINAPVLQELLRVRGEVNSSLHGIDIFLSALPDREGVEYKEAIRAAYLSLINFNKDDLTIKVDNKEASPSELKAFQKRLRGLQREHEKALKKLPSLQKRFETLQAGTEDLRKTLDHLEGLYSREFQDKDDASAYARQLIAQRSRSLKENPSGENLFHLRAIISNSLSHGVIKIEDLEVQLSDGENGRVTAAKVLSDSSLGKEIISVNDPLNPKGAVAQLSVLRGMLDNEVQPAIQESFNEQLQILKADAEELGDRYTLLFQQKEGMEAKGASEKELARIDRQMEKIEEAYKSISQGHTKLVSHKRKEYSTTNLLKSSFKELEKVRKNPGKSCSFEGLVKEAKRRAKKTGAYTDRFGLKKRAVRKRKLEVEQIEQLRQIHHEGLTFAKDKALRSGQTVLFKQIQGMQDDLSIFYKTRDLPKKITTDNVFSTDVSKRIKVYRRELGNLIDEQKANLEKLQTALEDVHDIDKFFEEREIVENRVEKAVSRFESALTVLDEECEKLESNSSIKEEELEREIYRIKFSLGKVFDLEEEKDVRIEVLDELSMLQKNYQEVLNLPKNAKLQKTLLEITQTGLDFQRAIETSPLIDEKFKQIKETQYGLLKSHHDNLDRFIGQYKVKHPALALDLTLLKQKMTFAGALVEALDASSPKEEIQRMLEHCENLSGEYYSMMGKAQAIISSGEEGRPLEKQLSHMLGGLEYILSSEKHTGQDAEKFISGMRKMEIPANEFSGMGIGRARKILEPITNFKPFEGLDSEGAEDFESKKEEGFKEAQDLIAELFEEEDPTEILKGLHSLDRSDAPFQELVQEAIKELEQGILETSEVEFVREMMSYTDEDEECFPAQLERHKESLESLKRDLEMFAQQQYGIQDFGNSEQTNLAIAKIQGASKQNKAKALCENYNRLQEQIENLDSSMGEFEEIFDDNKLSSANDVRDVKEVMEGLASVMSENRQLLAEAKQWPFEQVFTLQDEVLDSVKKEIDSESELNTTYLNEEIPDEKEGTSSLPEGLKKFTDQEMVILNGLGEKLEANRDKLKDEKKLLKVKLLERLSPEEAKVILKQAQERIAHFKKEAEGLYQEYNAFIKDVRAQRKVFVEVNQAYDNFLVSEEVKGYENAYRELGGSRIGLTKKKVDKHSELIAKQAALRPEKTDTIEELKKKQAGLAKLKKEYAKTHKGLEKVSLMQRFGIEKAIHLKRKNEGRILDEKSSDGEPSIVDELFEEEEGNTYFSEVDDSIIDDDSFWNSLEKGEG